MKKISKIVAFACLVAAGPAMAEILAKAGRLVDVEAGRVVTDAVVLIDGERITAVGPNLAIPAGARVIDLSKATVLPGLSDDHVHLNTNHDDGSWRRLGLSVPRQALAGAKNARLTLEAGFTATRSLP